MPSGDARGPSATTAIKDGKYQFDKESGPLPGAYQARVRLDAPAPPASNAPPTDPSTPPDKVTTRQNFGKDPLHPHVLEKSFPITVPEKGPWTVDIHWK
jgi:hypothetical protein